MRNTTDQHCQQSNLKFKAFKAFNERIKGGGEGESILFLLISVDTHTNKRHNYCNNTTRGGRGEWQGVSLFAIIIFIILENNNK
jgi:hypothetical protein